MRIVSFLPSATEIVCDLGLSDQLFGVTVECNWPAGVQRGREIVVNTFSDPTMTPGEIDALVRQRVADGLDLYTLDDAALNRCSPDLIVTQDLCRVCAVASGDVDAALDRLKCSATVLQLDPSTLEEVLASVEQVAQAAGVPERGRQYVDALRQRLAAVDDAVRALTRRRVFVLEWVDPPFGAGHWVPDLVTRAGGEPILARPGERSRATNWEDISRGQPEVVIVAPCGFNLDQAESQAREVIEQLPTTCEVWAIDADAVIVRPGPRLVDGVEALAALLHGVGSLPQDIVRQLR
ncbi:MAG: cobalamin-binding protein [Acidimicrobiales bacterium]